VKSDLIQVARLGRAYGTKGSLHLYPETDFLDRLPSIKRAFIGSDAVEREVIIERHGSGFIISISGIDDTSSAQSLVNEPLFIPEAERMPLGEGEHYIYDLIGVRLLDEGGVLLGEVEDVIQLPTCDAFVLHNDGVEYWLPYTEQAVVSEDMGRREMRVKREWLVEE